MGIDLQTDVGVIEDHDIIPANVTVVDGSLLVACLCPTSHDVGYNNAIGFADY